MSKRLFIHGYMYSMTLTFISKIASYSVEKNKAIKKNSELCLKHEFISLFATFSTLILAWNTKKGLLYINWFCIAQECHPQPMVVGDGLDNDCDGRVDEEICNDYKG